jgi:hypothetical protein
MVGNTLLINSISVKIMGLMRVKKKMNGVGDCRLKGVPQGEVLTGTVVSAMPTAFLLQVVVEVGIGSIGCSGSSIGMENYTRGVTNGR